MKLLRHGPSGEEKPGLLDAEGVVRDLSGHVADIDGATLASAQLDRLRALDPASLPAVAGAPRLGPPVAGVGKIPASGLNYADFVSARGLETPSEPVIFMKAPTAICGAYDDVVLPAEGERSDWEVELAIVIGRVARRVDEAEAWQYIAGYTICNDLSERDSQFERGGQWVKGKSFDTFAPLGPWLVTADEIPDPHGLDIWLDLNGERLQNSNTRNMIFSVPHLVAYFSRFMTLMPGDVIPTGTPPGIGMTQDPPRYLKPGDVMTLGIEGLGEQRQTCVAWSAGA